MKDNIFRIVFVIILLLHAVLLAWQFGKNEKERVVLKKHNKVVLKKMHLPKKKKMDKPNKIPKPVMSKIPLDYEDFLDEDEEEEEIVVEEVIFSSDIEYEEYVETGYSEAEIDDIKASYINLINANINLVRKYPKSARRLNQEGTVEVSFTILKDGRIIDVQLRNKSRFSSLNKSAVQAVMDIVKLDPIPDVLEKESWELIIPIKYELF